MPQRHRACRRCAKQWQRCTTAASGRTSWSSRRRRNWCCSPCRQAWCWLGWVPACNGCRAHTPANPAFELQGKTLTVSVQALLAPGDRVVCTMPGYQSLYEVASSLGCQVEPWPLRRQARGEGLLAAQARLFSMCGLQPVCTESIRCVSGRMRGSLASCMPSSNLPRTQAPAPLQRPRRLPVLPPGGCPAPDWRPQPAQAGCGQLPAQPLGALCTLCNCRSCSATCLCVAQRRAAPLALLAALCHFPVMSFALSQRE